MPDPGGIGPWILLSQPGPADGIVGTISTDLSMNWYYASQGQPAGPVSEEQLAELLRNGTVSATTLVWKNGLANWIPLSEALPGLLATAAATPGIPPVPIPTNASSPAPDPSPAPDRPMGAPATPTSAPDAFLSEEELLQADYPADIGAALRKGWASFIAKPLPLVGGLLLIWLLLMAASFIPCLGSIATLVVTGPLTGGLWMLYLRQVRTGSTDLGLIFSSFGPRFGQSFLVHLIPALVNLVVALPLIGGIIFFAVGGATLPGLTGNKPDFEAIWAAIGIGALIFWGFVILLTVAAGTVLALLWAFAMPLVVDKGYDFWPALQLSRRMVMKHFGTTLLFGIALWLISTLGLLVFCIGMLVSLPVAFLALGHWYETLFSRLRPKSPTR